MIYMRRQKSYLFCVLRRGTQKYHKSNFKEKKTERKKMYGAFKAIFTDMFLFYIFISHTEKKNFFYFCEIFRILSYIFIYYFSRALYELSLFLRNFIFFFFSLLLFLYLSDLEFGSLCQAGTEYNPSSRVVLTDSK